MDSSGSGYRPMAGSCEHSGPKERLRSIKGVEFLDYLSDYKLLKEDPAISR